MRSHPPLDRVMNVAQALELADKLMFDSNNRHLDDLERSIVGGVYQGKKYKQIANEYPCSESHATDVAASLWQALSDALGEKVKKANFKSTIERHQSKNISSSFVEQISLINICSEVTLNHHPIQKADRSNTPQYLKTLPDLVPIYDRSQELDSLKQWILTEQSRSIVIYGTAGIGKTALARQLLEDIKDNFQEIVWQSLSCHRSVVEFIDHNLIASLNIAALPEPPLDLEARLSGSSLPGMLIAACCSQTIAVKPKIAKKSNNNSF
jgi:ATPase domain predominantly from Archaea